MPEDVKGLEIKITKYAIPQLDPCGEVFNIIVKDVNSSWHETYGSKQEVTAFLRGLRAMAAFYGIGFLEVPEIPRESVSLSQDPVRSTDPVRSADDEIPF